LVLKVRQRLRNDTGDCLRFDGGEIVNVYDNGTIQVQGKNIERVREILGMNRAAGPVPGMPSRRVLVVYGHDEAAKTQLEAMLRRWGLEPLIMDQLPSEGATLIEKLEKYAGADVSFGVVLATPDDEGYAKGRIDEKRYRARQNVVLELGLLLVKLGRPRVAILLKDQENMERPSDIQGLIYLPFTDNVEEVKVLLAKEMQKQGIQIDVANL
jgi:predicted nucleotide-binding protein